MDRNRLLDALENLDRPLIEKIVREAMLASTPIGEGVLHITASIGVATLDKEDVGIETMLGRADEALYLAKNRGRNRVEAS